MKLRLEELERKVWRMEKLIWYIAGMISLRAGYDIIPIVQAIMG